MIEININSWLIIFVELLGGLLETSDVKAVAADVVFQLALILEGNHATGVTRSFY